MPARSSSRTRPGPLQWLWYAFGGGLPRELSRWVLADTTRRSWIVRHLTRSIVQVLPVIVAIVALVPVPLSYRLSVAGGGVLLALLPSIAFMTETIEHRVVKAGYPPGTAAHLRAERAEQDRLHRRAKYRRDGSGSFD